MNLDDHAKDRDDFFAALKAAERAHRETTRLGGDAALQPEQWRKTGEETRKNSIKQLTAAALGSTDKLSTFKMHLESQKAQILEVNSEEEILPAIEDALRKTEGEEIYDEPITLLSGDNPFISALRKKADEARSKGDNDLASLSDTKLKIINAGTAPLDVLREGEPDCIATAIAGAAESGTIILTSGPENPTQLNFLARRHVVLINKENIVTTYDEALQSIKNEPQAPRTINMISGPSRTADIEQTLTLGAHGPVEMIVVIYG